MIVNSFIELISVLLSRYFQVDLEQMSLKLQAYDVKNSFLLMTFFFTKCSSKIMQRFLVLNISLQQE